MVITEQTCTECRKIKFCFISFYIKNLFKKIKNKIGSKRLKEENHVKFLGVLVDSTLSWKPHIMELTKKINKNNWDFLQAKVLYS